MRSFLAGFFFVVVGCFSAPAAVLYSFHQPATPGPAATGAINFDFTVSSLLTTYTEIPASEIHSSLIDFAPQDLSIISVIIDPGLNNEAPYVGSRGVGFVSVKTGWGSQVVMSEGVCFDSNFSCYSTASPEGAQPFDHFGVYTAGGISLTISSTDPLLTATPEPSFAFGVGSVMLLMATSVASRSWARR